MNWMDLLLPLISALALTGAVGAAVFRRPVHAVLGLLVTLVALSLWFVLAGAAFLGLAQLLVYVGAVSVLIVFALLMTRGDQGENRAGRVEWLTGLGIALLLLGILGRLVTADPSIIGSQSHGSEVTVASIGRQLGGVLAPGLILIGVLLTVALVAALSLAADSNHKEDAP